MTDLKGKNIIVTGASGGIGNSIIEKLNQSGANILASGTRIEKLDEIKNKFSNIKTLNSLIYILASKYAIRNNLDDVILFNDLENEILNLLTLTCFNFFLFLNFLLVLLRIFFIIFSSLLFSI